MADPFRERTRRLQQRLLGVGASGAVFFPSPNCYYLSGFREEPMERHLLVFVPADGDPAIVAPDLYADQLADETWIDQIETYPDGGDPVALVREIGAELGISEGRLLLDPTMWARFTLDLRTAFPAATFELVEDVLAELRMSKDEAELASMETASEAADEVMERVRRLGPDAVGMTEADLAGWIRDELLERGQEVSFEVVVGSGPNGAKPHHRHGDRHIESGDPVVLDFGVRVDGYPSDMTRTVVFDGEPPGEFETAHDVVALAQDAAVNAVEPGVPAERIDELARERIEEAGFGDAFVHRTGHGIGLEVHEPPYIVSGNDMELEPGMVFSVEPGIYLTDAFGVRIEDLVVVTEDGGRRLNHVSRDWRV